jgi:hypothetical protein
MQQTIDIPSPSKADADAVITALETAAVFQAKGDGREAMRWLRRAAESASDAGDDPRALSLSRIAADLQEELNAAKSQTATPPPLPSSPSSPPAESRPRVTYPPPPSARAPRPSAPPRLSQAPRPLSSSPSNHAAARAVSTAPHLAAVPSNGLSAVPTNGVATEVDATPRHEPVAASPALAGTGARHAARVAVSISTSKAGYLELRLLAEGEAPRLGASEALLVMLDPASTLLAR